MDIRSLTAVSCFNISQIFSSCFCRCQSHLHCSRLVALHVLTCFIACSVCGFPFGTETYRSSGCFCINESHQSVSTVVALTKGATWCSQQGADGNTDGKMTKSLTSVNWVEMMVWKFVLKCVNGWLWLVRIQYSPSSEKMTNVWQDSCKIEGNHFWFV